MNVIHFRGKVIYVVVSVIGILLLVNILLIYENSKRIEHHKNVQHQVDEVKLNLVETVRTFHLLDIGLRGYALSPNPQLLAPFDSSLVRKVRLLNLLKSSLQEQQFDMSAFYEFESEVEVYYQYTQQMKFFLDQGDFASFKRLFEQDHGLKLVTTYRSFVARVQQFENEIQVKAEENYQLALKLNYWLQALLFLLAMPTLLYLAYYANRTFLMTEKLHQVEVEKALILENQNNKLEEEVHRRTQELLSLNEEVTAQNEEIVSQNEQLAQQQEEIVKQHQQLKIKHAELSEAKEMVTVQHALIQQHNQELIHEVESQTEYLMRANAELKERNSRLEQFTYVISHNLRGPLSRIQGLATILNMTSNEVEMKDISGKMSMSTRDLDRVVQDLATITEIRNVNTRAFSLVNLTQTINHVIKLLEEEIKTAKALINVQLGVTTIQSFTTYMESIFFNLISNAIKYKKQQTNPVIFVESSQKNNQIIIKISDNGIGIDLEKYGSSLFLPYKRFHHHVDGRGLGLYLVKSQVETLGGTLEINSRPDEGTTFTLTFSVNPTTNQ